MEELLTKKKRLLAVKKQLIRMPNNIKKANLVDGYANLFTYYKEALGDYDREYPELDLDDDDIEKYNQHVLKETRRKLIEINRLAPYLYERYSKLIDL